MSTHGRFRSGQEQAHTDAAKEGSEPALAVGPDYRKHWRWYHRFFHVLYTTMSSAALMLTIFYWALLYDPDEPEFDNFGMRAKNVMVHGLNSAIFLVDVMLTNVPVASYHVALIASYLGIYEVYMWLDFAVSRDWTYNDIGWSKGINIAFIFASCILAFLSHFGVLGVGYLRCLCCQSRCRCVLVGGARAAWWQLHGAAGAINMALSTARSYQDSGHPCVAGSS